MEATANEVRWGTQLRKGSLELAILAVLWGGERYGLEILQKLEQDWKLELSEGTIYPLLARLKAEGSVESRWVESASGHPRKYFAITRAGRLRAEQMAEQWREFAQVMNALVKSMQERKQP
jgi:PadR family transcriptional regulator, regulatory protein PadR